MNEIAYITREILSQRGKPHIYLRKTKYPTYCCENYAYLGVGNTPQEAWADWREVALDDQTLS